LADFRPYFQYSKYSKNRIKIIDSKFLKIWKGGGAAVYCVIKMNFWYLQMYKNKIMIQKNASANDIFETKLISN